METFLFVCCSPILIFALPSLPAAGTWESRASVFPAWGWVSFCAAAGKTFLPVSAPSNKTNVSVSPLLPGTWVTFGSQISDEVRAPLSTCVYERRPSPGTFSWQGPSNADLSRS